MVQAVSGRVGARGLRERVGRAVARGSPDMGRDGIECRGVWFDGVVGGRLLVCLVRVRGRNEERVGRLVTTDVCVWSRIWNFMNL